jgi:hypothetical protein
MFKLLIVSMIPFRSCKYFKFDQLRDLRNCITRILANHFFAQPKNHDE